MDLLFAFICDYADASGGKINALGIGFNVIHAAQVPAKHRRFFFVAKVRVNAAEAGEKDIQLSLIDEDGADVITPLKGKMSIPRPSGSTEAFGNLTVGFDNVEFKKYGAYALHFLVQGVTLTTVQLAVTPFQQVNRPDGPTPGT